MKTGKKATKKQDQHASRLYGDYILRQEIDIKIFITTLFFLIPILINAIIDENIRCYESIIVCMRKLIYISQVEYLR